MSEHDEQAAFVEYVLWTYSARVDFVRPVFFSVPNGAWLGGKSFAMMNKLKNEGFVPGVSDMLYLQPRGGYAYLAIEMKTCERRRTKNGGLSDEQSAFLDAVNKTGALATVCYGSDDAIRVFDNYMKLGCKPVS